MTRRIPVPLSATIVLALSVVLGVSLAQSWTAARPTDVTGWTPTRFGPLGPDDRALLETLWSAGLSVGPAGDQARRRGSTPAIRTLGARLATDDAAFGDRVRGTAEQLGVPLSTRSAVPQPAWAAELSDRSDLDYDRAFVQAVRLFYGRPLPVIAQVRAGTRNELVRGLAGSAADLFDRHIGYLEGTGLVDYASLAAAPAPAPAEVTGAGLPGRIVPAVVVVAALLAAVGLLTTLRRRARPGDAEPPPRTRPPAGRLAIPSPREPVEYLAGLAWLDGGTPDGSPSGRTPHARPVAAARGTPTGPSHPNPSHLTSSRSRR